LPLRRLTAAGLAVLLIHHPRKGVNLAGQAARGSGALASFVDILIEMHWYGKADEDDRRRWLRAYSRYEETRPGLVLELTPGGDDYLVHDIPVDAAGSAVWQVLSLVLQDACERLTQRQILEQWPEDFPRPDQATIWRALKRGAEQGLILKQGTGLRNNTFRYWLPGKEDDFPPGPNASADEKERFSRRYRKRFFEAIGMDPKAAGAAAAEEPADQNNLPAPAAPTALPTAPSAVSTVASPEPQPHQGASPLEPVPVPAPTPTRGLRKSCRQKPTRRAARLAVVAQEAKPVAATAPSPPPPAPAAPPPVAPVIMPTQVVAPRQPTPEELVAAERRRLRRWPYG